MSAVRRADCHSTKPLENEHSTNGGSKTVRWIDTHAESAACARYALPRMLLTPPKRDVGANHARPQHKLFISGHLLQLLHGTPMQSPCPDGSIPLRDPCKGTVSFGSQYLHLQGPAPQHSEGVDAAGEEAVLKQKKTWDDRSGCKIAGWLWPCVAQSLGSLNSGTHDQIQSPNHKLVKDPRRDAPPQAMPYSSNEACLSVRGLFTAATHIPMRGERYTNHKSQIMEAYALFLKGLMEEL